VADQLETVEQRFIADMMAYLDDLKRGADDAVKFAAANKEAASATDGLRDHSTEAAAALGHVRDEALAAAAAEKKLDDTNASLSSRLAGLKPQLKAVGDSAGAITGVGDAFAIFSKDASMASKVMSGFSLATGLLEAPLSGLIVGVGGLAAAIAAGGIGLMAFGAVAKSNYTAASTAANQVQTAQTSYNATVKAATFAYQESMATATTAAQKKAAATKLAAAQQSAETAQVKATAKAYDQLTPPQIALSQAIGNAKNSWQSFVQANTSGVSQIMTQGIGLLPQVFKMMQPFIDSTTAGLGVLMGKLQGAMGSGWLKSFASDMATFSGPAVAGIGTAIGNVIKGIAGIVDAFIPMGVTVLGGLDKITAKFATWGQTITQHSGFQSLMQMAQADMPYVIEIVKNLGTAIVNLGKSMTGLSSFSNSKMLLQMAAPLSQLVAYLSQANPALLRFGLYALAAGGAVNKLRPAFEGIKGGIDAVKGGASAFRDLSAGFSNSAAAASEATGVWGTVGGKISSIGDALVSAGAAAGRFAVSIATTAARTAVDFAVTAARAVASAAVTVASFLAEAAAATVAFVAENLATLGIVAGIMLLIAGIVLLATHWKQVWGDIKNWALDAWHFLDNDVFHPIMHAVDTVINFVRAHWALILGILTGPIGLAVYFIVSHWDTIRHETAHLVDDVVGFLKSLPGRILSALGNFASLLWNAGVALIQGLINGIQSMFSSLGSVASSIGHFIASLKGPLPKDLVLLVPHGQAIMQGLMDGITSKKGELAGLLGGLTGGIPGMVGGAGGGGNVGAPSVHVTVPLTLGAGTAGYSDPRFLQYLQQVVQEAILRYTMTNPTNGLNLAGKL
jgi:hypothetical protein